MLQRWKVGCGRLRAVKIVVLAIGRLRPPFADDVAHYRQLLGGKAKVELIEVRTDEQAIARIPERAFVSLLDAEGKTYDSEGFSQFIQDRQMAGLDVWFVLGGAFGNLALPRVDHKLSLGEMTLPHQLARVVLLEQLFRAHKILAGEPYHY